MGLTTAGKNWLAINAGVNNCFSPTGVSFVDADGVPFTMGTKDVVITFIGAHLVGKDTAIIIANTNYSDFKAINGGLDLTYPDATWVSNNDGHTGTLYCYPISTELTVSTNDCNAPCTVTGTVAWINNGTVVSSPIDLSILVNSAPTSVATGVVINPGETKSYTFSLPDLAVGTYTVEASPNTGTTPQVITVTLPPANIISTELTVSTNDCNAPCTVTGTVAWINNGGETGTLDPTILFNGSSISLGSSEPINPGETKSYTFSLPDLAVGTYTVEASPNTGTTPQVITVTLPPANIISTELTVSTNACYVPCTITGTVKWANNGGVASSPIDLSILVNSAPTSVATGVVINPGETKSYTFSLPDLAVGTYTVEASPNTGTTPQVITVTLPANIISIDLTLSTYSCLEKCNVTGSVSWRNDGGETGTLDPAILINGSSVSLGASEPINPGQTITHGFSLSPDLLVGTYEVCANPGTLCVTLTVQQIRASFSSTPSGATLYIDDVIQPDVTPTTVIGLTPELHTYKMTHPDCSGNEITGDFTAVAGDIIEISETFNTSVHITSSPSGARIWIDDTDKGVNTPNTIVVDAGHHTYKLTKEGYKDYLGEFDITECQRITIPASITKIQEASIGGLVAIGLLFGWLLFGRKKEEEKKKS